MRYCPECHKEFPNDDLFCDVDGTKLKKGKSHLEESAEPDNDKQITAASTKSIQIPLHYIIYAIAIVAVIWLAVSNIGLRQAHQQQNQAINPAANQVNLPDDKDDEDFRKLTLFPEPLPHTDVALILSGENTVSVTLTNYLGRTVLINTTDDYNGTGDCANPTQFSASSPYLYNDGIVILTWTCPPLKYGERFTSDLRFKYTNTYTEQSHIHIGSVSGIIS